MDASMGAAVYEEVVRRLRAQHHHILSRKTNMILVAIATLSSEHNINLETTQPRPNGPLVDWRIIEAAVEEVLKARGLLNEHNARVLGD